MTANPSAPAADPAADQAVRLRATLEAIDTRLLALLGDGGKLGKAALRKVCRLETARLITERLLDRASARTS